MLLYLGSNYTIIYYLKFEVVSNLKSPKSTEKSALYIDILTKKTFNLKFNQGKLYSDVTFSNYINHNSRINENQQL